MVWFAAVARACPKVSRMRDNTRSLAVPIAFLVTSFTMAQLTQDSATAAESVPACTAAVYRHFDFWLGHWEVRNAKGDVVGHNLITAREQGCVLVEEWRSTSGNTGISMNHYDPRLRLWRQHWVGGGVILEMSGGLKGKVMVLEGPMSYIADGRQTRLRGEWSVLPDGRVRQHFTESADDGKTWQEWFDGYYKRVP